MIRFAIAAMLIAGPASGAELHQIPGIVAGKKAKMADWKAAASLEGFVQAAAKDAGHGLVALGGKGKEALACQGNVDCLAGLAKGKPGYAVVVVVWAMKNKRLGELALFDLATMKKIAGVNGAINAKLAAQLMAAVPAPKVVAEKPAEPAKPAAAAQPAAEAKKPSAAPAAKTPAVAQAKKAAAEPAKASEAAAKPAAAKAAPSKAAPKVATTAGGMNPKVLPYSLIGGGLALTAGGIWMGTQSLATHDSLVGMVDGPVRDETIGKMRQQALIADLMILPGLAVAGAGTYLLVH